MPKSYKYFSGKKDKDFVIKSMKNYFYKKQELDKLLETLISPYLLKKKLNVLDACCGLGHISYMLGKKFTNSTFTGIDQTSYLIQEAKQICNDQNNISFFTKDIYNLPKKYQKLFDVSVNWKTISWLPYYEDILRVLFSVTKNHIFLSSLFYDGDIDFEIKVREFKKESGKNNFNVYYNVYSLPKFKKYLYDLGAKKIQSYDFEINTDLPRPPIDQMGTYTEQLTNGKRLQISGNIVMNWKIIRIDL